MNQRILLSVIAVTGALLFSGYGNAESQAQKKSSPAAEQPPQKQFSEKTKGAISFKGIPLGKPGVKNALQKMCKEKKFNPEHDRCSFNENSSQLMLNYENMVDAFALVTLGSGDALIKVEIDSSTPELLGLAKALEAKFGKPQKTSTVIKNAIGTQFDKDTFVWVDDQGSRITIESIFYDYNKGGVVIESAAAIAAQEAAAKKAKETAKSNP